MDYIFNVGLSIVRSIPWIIAIWGVYWLAKHISQNLSSKDRDKTNVEKIVKLVCYICTALILITSVVYTPFTYKNFTRDNSNQRFQQDLHEQRIQRSMDREVIVIPATRESQQEREERTHRMLDWRNRNDKFQENENAY